MLQLSFDEREFQDSPLKQLQKKSKVIKKQFYLPVGQPNQFEGMTLKQVQQKLAEDRCLDYFKRKKKGKYLYYICRFCIARLVIVQQGRLRFIKFQNYHMHDGRNNKKIQQELIQSIMESSHDLQSPQQLRTRILNMIPIGINRYNYILRKLIDKNCYQNASLFLNQNHYITKITHHQQEQLPELMLFMSPQQKKIALKFNDSFSFDITYNLLKNRSKDLKQWGVGIFTTFDTNLRIIPIAYAIVLRQNTNTFATLFRGFLQCVENRTCTIITDNQASIKAGLRVLSQKGIFNGNHALDSFHLLRNIRKNVPQQQFSLYHTLITTKYPLKFQKALQILSDYKTNPFVLDQIKQNAEAFCFSMGKPKFVGLNFSSSGTQKCNDFLKTIIPRETNIYRLILAFKKIENRVKLFKNKFQLKKYEIIFDDKRIEEVRLSVEQKIFKVFLSNYVKGLKCQIKRLSEEMYEVNGAKTTGRDCECLFTIRTGIPCYHMLAILIKLLGNISYLHFFNYRWTDLIQRNEAHKKTGSRKSRRRK